MTMPESLSWRSGMIERIAHTTPRVTNLWFRVALGPHIAGQHVDVRLTAPDGYQAQRSYSIASAPGAPLIELAVEAFEDGEVSPYLCEIAQVGDTIELRGPIGGHFIWSPNKFGNASGAVLMVGGGSGVVPLMSIVRSRAALNAVVRAASPTLLLYSARGWEDLIFRDELIACVANDPTFMLRFVTTRGGKHRDFDFDQRLDEGLLRTAIAQWGQTPQLVYACGSNAFVETITSALVKQSIPAERIRAERYGGTS